MGRTVKQWECSRCGRHHISLKYYDCSCVSIKNNSMTAEAKSFHLYFSIIRDIIADDEKAKMITKKIVDEIIDSHLHIYDNSLKNTLNYWRNVRQETDKL